jgi:hypothetical protein
MLSWCLFGLKPPTRDFKETQMKRRSLIFSTLIIFMILSESGRTQEAPSVEIAIRRDHIQQGDPAVLHMTFTFAKAPTSRFTPGPQQVIKEEDLLLLIRPSAEQTQPTVTYRLPPVRLHLESETGGAYVADLIVWYEMHKTDDKWQIVFDTPGKYELVVTRGGEEVSNPASIVVDPSAVGQKGLALLATHENFAFLAGRTHRSPQTVACLENLVKQCRGTMLAQMAAARLGIEETRELENKYPEGEKFMARYKAGEIQEPLVASARSHLSEAQQLPDEYPLRETVLNSLATTELAAGNYTRALSLVDELAAHYPRGEYGSRARSRKGEITALMEKEAKTGDKQQAPARGRRPRLMLLGTATIVSAAILVGAVVAVYAFVLRRRRVGPGR